MKKQKKSIIIVSIILLTAAITAAAAGTYGALTQPQKQQPGVQLTAQRSAAVGELNDPIYTYLGNHYSGEELYEKVEAYATFKISQQPTAEEIQHMANLLDGGSLLEAVLDAYQFWMTTNAEFSLVDQLVQAYQPEFVNASYWAEEVYDSLTQNPNVLSEEDVDAYMQQGISADDILLANELSRKNVYTIQQILTKRQQETAWFDIIAEVYNGLNYPLVVENTKKDSYQKIEDGRYIIKAIFLSKRSGQALEEWLDMAAADTATFRMASSQYITKLYADEIDMLKARGLYALPAEEADELAQHEAYLDAQLQAAKVDMQQVQALEEQGYAKEEILNAAVDAKAKGRSVQQQLQQER